MKLSDRDKKLILGILLVAIIVLPIFLFIRPKNEKIKGLDAELVSLNERYDYLKGLSEKQPFYEAEIIRLGEEREKLIQGFAQGLKQENTIMFLRGIELSFPITMTAENFGGYNRTHVSDGYYNNETQSLEGDLEAVSTSTTVSYVCDYEIFKYFLNYIFTYNEKMTIPSITASYNPADNSVNGSFTINEYAFEGSGRSVDTAKIPTLDRGNNYNIFTMFDSTIPIEDEELEEEEAETDETSTILDELEEAKEVKED